MMYMQVYSAEICHDGRGSQIDCFYYLYKTCHGPRARDGKSHRNNLRKIFHIFFLKYCDHWNYNGSNEESQHMFSLRNHAGYPETTNTTDNNKHS